jgi:A/G-specific adenine glycosylase
VARHGGRFPRDFDSVEALPGIGRSTAGAILAQACGARLPILEGNARRVLARHAGVRGWPGTPAVASRLWRIAESRLPASRMADYTQAVMDLGATLCTPRAPACGRCPVAADCVARARGLTARIPSPRPRRVRPHRHARLLLIRNAAGELLLERRPTRGIWGGLWCPPLLPEEKTGEAGSGSTLSLPSVRHAFTHFDLTLRPVHLRRAPAAALGGGNTDWVKLSRLPRLGLPAPVRSLLSLL